jgi:Predicted membrane protein (DUF2207)
VPSRTLSERMFDVNDPRLTKPSPGATLSEPMATRGTTPAQTRRVLVGCAIALAAIIAVVVVVVLGNRFLRGLEQRIVGVQTPALIGAAVATALWLGGLGLLRLARSPREPGAGPPTSDLGPEPPAIVDMLTNHFRVEREAVPATLLDLAARRFLDLEGIGPELRVRVREAEHSSLLPYERRVLDLVRSRAVGGVVPAAALTSGPQARAKSWWKSFRNELIDDAQARGLSRDLWDARILTLFTAAALLPAALVLLAARNWVAPVAYLVGATTLVAFIRGGRRQRHTDQGLRVAARWLGVGRHLRDDPAFQDLPPAAVAVWERYLAYAAAMGAARAAVRQIPMGADEDRRAWSAYGGQWRLVRIRYPWLWPPAWGWRPWAALLVSVVGGLVAVVALRLAAGIGWAEASATDPPGLVAFVRGLFLFFLGVGTVVALWSLPTLVRAATDLGSAQEIAGLVLRVRTFGGGRNSQPRHYVAIDDGRSPMIWALRVVRPEIYGRAGPSEYQEATATVSGSLRHVRELR